MGVWTPLGILDAAASLEAYCQATSREADKVADSPRRLFAYGAAYAQLLEDAVSWALGHNPAGTVLHLADKVRLLSPVGRPGKILCIGLNYRDHCTEQGKEPPKTPLVFAKFPNSILEPGGEIMRPRITRELDYEAELGVVIGKNGRHVPQAEALEYVGGYLNVNDVSARDLQRSDGQWTRAKSSDTFAPMGPFVVTRDEVPDPQDLAISCRVNGEVVQHSNTNQMVFPVSYLISFISEFTTLEVGDVIATGTPAGVGVWRKPPRFLKPGDAIEVEVEGLGVLRSTVRAEKRRQDTPSIC